jgi:hypothetical protein
VDSARRAMAVRGGADYAGQAVEEVQSTKI